MKEIAEVCTPATPLTKTHIFLVVYPFIFLRVTVKAQFTLTIIGITYKSTVQYYYVHERFFPKGGP